MDIQQTINSTISERMKNRPEESWDGSEPNFYRIALELEHLEALCENGWWGDWWGCDYSETILRCFGPLVSLAAAGCENGSEGSSATTTVSVLNGVDFYLGWQADMMSCEDNVTIRLIETAQGALEDLNIHLRTRPDQDMSH